MSAFVVGFVIAIVITLTGIGGGTIATPLLIIFLGMKGAVAIGTALTFAAIVKFVVAPLYVMRKQVSWQVLGWMLLGGLPGVLIGGKTLVAVNASMNQKLLFAILGFTIVATAIFNIVRLVRTKSNVTPEGHRPRWLGLLMFPVGAEMGFSSVGSGALGTSALMGMTKLDAAHVVGTSILFGLALSIVGGGVQILAGNFDGGMLVKLLVGGLAGAAAGGLLAHRIPSRPLKWAMSLWLAGLGVQLFVRGLS
jgi:uncharacterized membrane protein YfcA